VQEVRGASPPPPKHHAGPTDTLSSSMHRVSLSNSLTWTNCPLLPSLLRPHRRRPRARRGSRSRSSSPFNLKSLLASVAPLTRTKTSTATSNRSLTMTTILAAQTENGL
jgi:hypothetical protein